MKLALLSFLSGFVRFKSHRSQQGRKPRCQALCGSFYESFPGKLHRQPSTPVESRWMTGRERVYKRDNIMSSGICRGRGKQSARYERITAEYVAHTSTILLPLFLPPPPVFFRFRNAVSTLYSPIPFSFLFRICFFSNIFFFVLHFFTSCSIIFYVPSLPSEVYLSIVTTRETKT